MGYETSFSNPHQVFLTNEKKNELNINTGDPVQVEFNGFDDPVVAKVSDISDLQLEEELHAMFFSIHYCLDDIGEVHDGLFSDLSASNIEIGNHISESLQDSEGIGEYLSRINHLNEFRFERTDIVIGCGIADLLVRSEPDENYNQILSPFSQHSQLMASKSMNGDLPEIEEIQQYDGNLIRSGNMYVCTYNSDLHDSQKEELRDHIANDRYIMPSITYEYYIGNAAAHGMITDRETDDILIATKDNIRFSRRRTIQVEILGEKRINLGDLHEYISEKIDDDQEYEFEISYEEEEVIRLILGVGGQIVFQESEPGFSLSIVHITEENPEEVERWIASLLFGLKSEFDIEVELAQSPGKPSKTLLAKDWVLDTNTIYRQKRGENYNSIAVFLLNNPYIYDRNFIVPWNVLCEINRHKDSNVSSTRKDSKQGVENLIILNILNSSGIINLVVENIPEAIDNSIQEGTGITDLAILKSVPDEGVLITSDNHLSNLADLLKINTESIENINRLSEQESKVSYWNILKDHLLQNAPVEYQSVIQMLELEKEESTENMIDKSPAQIIREKIRDGQVIEMAKDGEIYISLSREKEVIPTFTLINKIISEIENVGGDSYLTENSLEDIRRAIGGMPTTHRPNLTFLIPSEYVFKSSEISQIDAFESLRNLNNSRFNTIDVDRSNGMNADIEDAVIRASLNENSRILCSPQEDVRKYNLLGIEFSTVRFTG